MSAPTTLAQALQWALRRLETAGLGDGENFHAASAILASESGHVEATDNADGRLSNRQCRVIEEVATICNAMRDLTREGADVPGAIFGVEMALCRAGALADSLIGGKVVGTAADWIGVRL